MTVIDLAITLQVSEDDKDLEPYRLISRVAGSWKVQIPVPEPLRRKGAGRHV